MPDRRVTFQISTPSRGSSRSHRNREPGYDSGVGSSSSGQASSGSRADHRFTAEDYEDQLYSVSALQEALSQANRNVDILQRRCSDMDVELADAHKETREMERLYRDECERYQRVDKLNKELKEQNAALNGRIRELEIALDDMTDERDKYQKKYEDQLDSVTDITIRGGSGESSSRVHRSGSRNGRESKGATKKHGEEKANSSRHHHRRSSVSITTSTGSKKPYIERMPGEPSRPPSSRYSGNYTTAAIDFPADPNADSSYAAVPRSSSSAASGNYIPYPLQEPRGHRRS